MATAELTARAPGTAPGPGSPAGGIATQLRRVGIVSLVVWTATGVGVLLGALAPGLAPPGPPHPALRGSASDAVSILATNLRILLAPFLLALLRADRSERGRLFGDVLIAVLVFENTLRVGLALGRFGGSLLPYVPQLPLEWLALAVSTSAWISIRRGASPSHRRHGHATELCLLLAATLACAAAAAACETLLTPRLDASAHPLRHSSAVQKTKCSQSIQVAAWEVDCLRPDRAPATALLTSRSHSLPSPRCARFRSAAQPARMGFVNHHPSQTEGTA